jgi:hypothetical protein
MKLSRIIAATLCLTAAAFAFAEGQKEEAKQAGPVTIIYYLWDDPSLKPLVDAFNASQKDVIVDARYIPSPDYETKITTLLTAKAEMDCYMQKRQSDMFAHWDNGFIEPLDDLLKKTGSIGPPWIPTRRRHRGRQGRRVPVRRRLLLHLLQQGAFREGRVPTPDTYGRTGLDLGQVRGSRQETLFRRRRGVRFQRVFLGFHQLLMEAQKMKPIIDSKGTINYDSSILRWFQMRKQLEEAKAMWPLIDMK